jgi:hypothetical protein
MAPFELVGACHQRRRTRPSSLSSAVADLSLSSERSWRSQGVDFDDFLKHWRALEGHSRGFVDHAGGCGVRRLCGRVGAVWLVTGPILNARVRPRRMTRWGPEARE